MWLLWEIIFAGGLVKFGFNFLQRKFFKNDEIDEKKFEKN